MAQSSSLYRYLFHLCEFSATFLLLFDANIKSRRVYIICFECVYVWQEATIYCLGGNIELCGNNNTSSKHKGGSSNHGNDDDLQSPCSNSTDTFYSLNINLDSNFARLQNSWEVVRSDFIVSKHFTMSATNISSMNNIVSFFAIYLYIQK